MRRRSWFAGRQQFPIVLFNSEQSIRNDLTKLLGLFLLLSLAFGGAICSLPSQPQAQPLRPVTIEVTLAGDDDTPFRPEGNTLGPYASTKGVARALALLAPIADKIAVTVAFGSGTFRADRPIEVDGRISPFGRLEFRGTGLHPTIVTGARSPTSDDSGHRYVQLEEHRIADYLAAKRGLGHPIYPYPFLVWSADQPAPPARWPPTGWATVSEATREGAAWRLRLSGTDTSLPIFNATHPVRLNGYFAQPWAFESVPARSGVGNELEVLAADLRYGITPGARVFLDNAPTDSADSGVRLDLLHRRLTFSGSIPYIVSTSPGFLRLRSLDNVTITNLTITDFTGDAVSLESLSNTTITHNIFRRIGNRAVSITDGRSVLIANNDIRLTGEGGIEASGGNRITLESSSIFISNNQISRFSELSRTYRPAIKISGVGIYVNSNVLHDGPHTAIIFEGNDHTITDNYIHDVVTESLDAGAIYALRDWTTYGTAITSNIFKDITARISLDGPASEAKNSVRAIYLDDFTSGVRIADNIFFNTDYAIFVNGGRDNLASRNYCIRCRPSYLLNPLGLNIPRSRLGPDSPMAVVLKQLKDQRSVLLQRYPRLQAPLDELAQPTGNTFVSNFLINSFPPRTYENRADTFVQFADNVSMTVAPDRLFPLSDIHTYSEARDFLRRLVSDHR